MLTLTPLGATAVPLEAECLVPERLAALTPGQIEALPVWHGNRTARLGEFFAVRGDPRDEVLRIDGDVAHVKWIGKGMTRGRIEILGRAGMHLGSGMSGGEILVHGSAGDWLGAEMAGGVIRVRGDAGHLVGAAYRGAAEGMTGGIIVVEGNAGNEVGAFMARGLVAVFGDVGDFAGLAMAAGTVVVGGRAGLRAGAWMQRGSVVLLSDEPPSLLPTQRYACTFRPDWLRLYLRKLASIGAPVPPGREGGRYRLYSGDEAVGGRGEVLVWAGAEA